MTLFSLFAETARKAGNKPAIRLRNSIVSYTELYDRVLQRAAQLQAQIAEPGGIAIVLRDRVKLLSAFLACAAIGRPAAPIDPDLPPVRLAAISAPSPLTWRERAECAAFRVRGNCTKLNSSVSSYCHFAAFLLDPGLRFEVSRQLTGIQIEDDSSYPVPALSNDPHTEFYWGLTSGTIGEPKLVARSHASWIASFEAAEAVFDFRGGDTVLVPGPLHHSLFLYGAVHGLCRGHCLALPPARFRADKLPAFCASHLYAVPFMLCKLAAARTQMPGLRQIFCGGAKLSPALREACEALWTDADLVEFYGSTETSFVSFHSTKKPAPENSVGRIFPGVRIEIRDKDSASAAKPGNGEIFVASDMLYDRYVGGKRAAQWVSVGDIGWLDAQNCLYLTGRRNRIINSKGLKIHPEQIETALASRPEIEAAAVIGVPDRLRGAAAIAVVSFRLGQHSGRAALSAFCRSEFGEGYSPLRFYESDSLPKTSSGKIALSVIAEALAKSDPAYRELI